jgi:outer membrane lipoprotein SlyB
VPHCLPDWVILCAGFNQLEDFMETTQPSRTHPLILVAAIAVTIAALAGVGVLTGVLPNPAAAPAPETPAMQTQEPAPLAETPPEPAKTSSAPHVAKKTSKPAKVAVSSAPTYVPPPAPAKCNDCGTIEEIRTLNVEPTGSGVGGVAGGVVGGLLGNQVGQGRGRTAATVAGVVGGALVGNKIEKNMKKAQTYETVVRYEDGTTQIFPSETLPAWRVGDKVRVENGVLTSR